jgi:hypothetical protein
LARRHLIGELLRRLDFATHELPFRVLEPIESIFETAFVAERLVSDAPEGFDSEDLSSSIRRYRRLVEIWLEFKEAQDPGDFWEFCRARGTVA